MYCMLSISQIYIYTRLPIKSLPKRNPLLFYLLESKGTEDRSKNRIVEIECKLRKYILFKQHILPTLKLSHQYIKLMFT